MAGWLAGWMDELLICQAGLSFYCSCFPVSIFACASLSPCNKTLHHVGNSVVGERPAMSVDEARRAFIGLRCQVLPHQGNADGQGAEALTG
mmetsp:Transcript_3928/g.9939  ORF Transcript_3928/g.9939 Transcript_3928/m.9939 type:complete len:91 (-) Transcript_3928:2127-2399(-)